MGADASTSFIILAGGQRTASLTSLCTTIASTAGEASEIIVVGSVSNLKIDGMRIIHRPDLAESGKICRMRNIAAEEASGEILLFLDDDIEIEPSWFARMEKLFVRLTSRRADIGTCRVVGPGGRRWYDWSWASRENPACPTMLLPYFWRNRNLYISGCCMIMRNDVWRDLRFAEDRGYYQNDDIEFCHRATDRGYQFACRTETVIKHLLLPSGRGDSLDAFAETIYLYRLGNVAQATNRLEAARLEIEPGIYWYYKGYFSFLLGDRGKSQEYLSRSVESFDPGSTGTLLGQAHYRLGLALLATGQKEDAGLHFQRALRSVPDHPFARARLNRLLRGRLDIRGILQAEG